MRVLSNIAFAGLFLAIADASRCKTRPGYSSPNSSVESPVAPVESSTVSSAASSTAVTPATSPEAVSSTVSSEAPVQTSAEAPSSSSTAAPVVTSSSSEAPAEATPTSASSSSVATSATTVGSVVAIANAPAATQMCAENEEINLPEWGLVVANFRVEESSVEGTVCTTYNGMYTLPNGQAAVNFTADANLVYDEATINDNKYYSNAGLGENMNQQLSAISSIPAAYTWSRTNTTNFRGNVAFDLVLAPTSGDRTSSATEEVMMWLHWQGDQLPLAWDNGTKASFDLYGTTWDMYQGVNYNLAGGAGVRLTTILPQQDLGASGSWSGDLMDWMQALVSQGTVTEDYYVTNANAGTEQYWGDSVLESSVALRIDLKA